MKIRLCKGCELKVFGSNNNEELSIGLILPMECTCCGKIFQPNELKSFSNNRKEQPEL